MTATLRVVHGTLPDPDTRPAIYVTPGERHVLDAFMKDGACNRVVAERCKLSEDTAKTHMRNIYAKAASALDTPDGRMDRTALAITLCRGKLRVLTCHMPAFHDPDRFPAVPEGHTCPPM